MEIDTSCHSPQTLHSDPSDLNHSITQTSLTNADNALLSAATTANAEMLPAHLSSSRATNIECLESSEGLLMPNPNCIPSSSHLEDNSEQNLIDQNGMTSSQAASFLSYVQEHQGNTVGIGKEPTHYFFIFRRKLYVYIHI